MLISIRGANGSGKTTLVLSLLKDFRGKPVYGLLGAQKPEAYELKVPKVKRQTFVLGPYHVASGGCDQFAPYDLIFPLLEKYAKKGHVVFEGMLVSSSYGRVGKFMETLGHETVFAFMATSLEDCIKNVNKRRGSRGDHREFDPKNVVLKYECVERSRKVIAAVPTTRSVDLTIEEGPLQVIKLLRSAK